VHAILISFDDHFGLITHCHLLVSLQDSSHGGALGKDERMTPLDQQYQFLGRLQFPVTTDTEAWSEKVSFRLKGVFMSLLFCYYFVFI